MDSPGVHTASSQSQPLRFRCPGCQEVLQSPPQYAGRKVKCSKCSQLLQIPNLPPHNTEPLKPKNFIICICGTCKHIFKTPPGATEQAVTCPSCAHTVEIPTKTGRISASDTFRFKCGSCQQEYCVLSKYGGKKFTCLACKQATAIPKPAAAPALDLVDPDILESPEVVADDIPQYQLKNEPDDESVLAPQEFDVSRVRRPTTTKPTHKKTRSESSPLLAKLKIPLIAIAGIAGLIIGFLVITSLFKGGSDTDIAGPVQSPEAIAFAEDNVTLLHEMKPKDLRFRFRDEVPVDADQIQELAYSVSLGEIENIASAVTYSKVGEGAAGYIVESVITYAGQFTRTVQAGICIGTEWTEDEYGYLVDPEEVSSLVSLKVLNADGAELHAIGETADYLITRLNTFVAENVIEILPGVNSTVIFTLLIVFLISIFITLFSQIAIFVRAGEPGWAVFVPIYREVCMARIAEKPEILGVVCGIAFFVPSIGQVAYLILFCMFSIGIARAFDKGILFGLGLAFLPVIFYPILAFSGNAYD